MWQGIQHVRCILRQSNHKQTQRPNLDTKNRRDTMPPQPTKGEKSWRDRKQKTEPL
ncbi:hypothetical protein [Klebsiella phage pKP-BS317-1.1]|nr:hypothetical protein [Klebsiella phage pKP-BS317-1.1]